MWTRVWIFGFWCHETVKPPSESTAVRWRISTVTHKPEVNPRIQFPASHLQTFSRQIPPWKTFKTACRILDFWILFCNPFCSNGRIPNLEGEKIQESNFLHPIYKLSLGRFLHGKVSKRLAGFWIFGFFVDHLILFKIYEGEVLPKDSHFVFSAASLPPTGTSTCRACPPSMWIICDETWANFAT